MDLNFPLSKMFTAALKPLLSSACLSPTELVLQQDGWKSFKKDL